MKINEKYGYDDLDYVYFPKTANFEKLHGKKVKLPDGGVGTIDAVCIGGLTAKVEWAIVFWYNGCRNLVWLEPNEVQLLEVEEVESPA